MAEKLQIDRFDLLSSVGGGASMPDEKFYVTFDWYTPRPHYIIMEKPPTGRPPFAFRPDLPLLREGPAGRADAEFLHALIGAGKKTAAVVRKYFSAASGPEREPITLSIHRGQWISSKEFHAHVCTDVDSYVGVYRKMVADGKVPGSFQKPLSKNWKLSSTSFAENVAGYPYRGYFDEEVQDIGDKGKLQLISCSEIRPSSGIVFHDRYARIGFRQESRASSGSSRELELIRAMETFAASQQLSANNKVRQMNDHRGCHLCVSLDDRGFSGFGSYTDVFGYIKLTGPVVYKMMPADIRESWFEKFSRSSEKVLT